jgi:two-component system, sporulation sensor kinase E
MEEVLMILREKAESRGIRMINKMNRSLESQAQKDRLKQAFCNIILNSIEAIGTKGTIEVTGETKNRFVEIAVKDSGMGIKKDQIPAIFEYYYTTKDKGMGLGLPISYMVIKDHNGEIRVTSEEGKGTTFLITLPSSQPKEQKAEGEKTRKGATGKSKDSMQ